MKKKKNKTKKKKKKEKEKKTVLTFARREGRPSDSIRYMKGRRTPSARMHKVMSRRITGRRRKGESVGNVRSTQRGRVRFRTDDRNVFWLRYTARAKGWEEGNKQKKKKRRNRGRARIYRVTLSGLFQRRPKAELVLSSSFQSRPFIKSSRAAALIFFLASTQDFFPFLFFFFFCHCLISRFSGDVALLREI